MQRGRGGSDPPPGDVELLSKTLGSPLFPKSTSMGPAKASEACRALCRPLKARFSEANITNHATTASLPQFSVSSRPQITGEAVTGRGAQSNQATEHPVIGHRASGIGHRA